MAGVSSVNKFGHTKNADNADATDIWDAAAQFIWLAPTAARNHSITSSSDDDGKTGSPASAGARTMRVYGLKTWDSTETSEVVTLTGTDPVITANDYVCIHRMKILTCGASGPNVGLIQAQAADDNTVTALISAAEGQTLMAIYGVPSTQVAYLTQFYTDIERDSPVGADAEFKLLWTPDVVNQPTVFMTKHKWAMSVGDPPYVHPYNPYNGFAGPGILKIQALSDQDDTHINAGFDLILVDN